MMSGSRFSAVVFGAGLLALGAVQPASAQGLSQFGLWGEAPERSSPAPAFLGAGPALVKPGAALASGGARPAVAARAPQTIAFQNGFVPGSVIIDTAGRKLYYTLSERAAYVYPIAVGKQGFAWSGVERVSKIEDWPDWIPPKEMRQRMPSLPVRMTGGLRNPLGAKAIYLGNTLYRIHGTNDAKSIGSASSSGCFRMHNEHVVHLAQHVDAGTTVFVMRRLPKSGPVMPPADYRPAVTVPVENAGAGGTAGAPAAGGAAETPEAQAQPETPPAAETAPQAEPMPPPAEWPVDHGI